MKFCMFVVTAIAMTVVTATWAASVAGTYVAHVVLTSHGRVAAETDVPLTASKSAIVQGTAPMDPTTSYRIAITVSPKQDGAVWVSHKVDVTMPGASSEATGKRFGSILLCNHSGATRQAIGRPFEAFNNPAPKLENGDEAQGCSLKLTIQATRRYGVGRALRPPQSQLLL